MRVCLCASDRKRSLGTISGCPIIFLSLLALGLFSLCKPWAKFPSKNILKIYRRIGPLRTTSFAKSGNSDSPSLRFPFEPFNERFSDLVPVPTSPPVGTIPRTTRRLKNQESGKFFSITFPLPTSKTNPQSG